MNFSTLDIKCILYCSFDGIGMLNLNIFPNYEFIFNNSFAFLGKIEMYTW